MKAFKNRLEEMAEATVNALDYSDSKVEYPDISMVQKWPKEIILPLPCMIYIKILGIQN